MAHLAMLVIFHVIVIICQIFNLPHIYHIFAKKISFFRWKISNLSHGIQTWFKLCEMTWFNILSTFIKIKNHLSFFWSKFVFLNTHVHHILFPQIYSNLPIYKMKWNHFFSNILPKVYSNIICKNVVKIFQSLRWDTLKHAHPWKVIKCHTLKGSTIMCFHPKPKCLIGL